MVYSYKRAPTGFSLIELLVVIAIINVLVGLLLAGVMSARQSAERLKCQNNMKQIGLAMHNYASFNGGFPPLVSYSLGWNNSLPTGTIHLWSAYLLPHVDQQPVADRYDFTKPFFANTEAIATPLAIFYCPA